ncbi:MAG: DUF4345 domain-containing protein [Myxococcota bacterium]
MSPQPGPYDPGPRTPGAKLTLRVLFVGVAGLFLFRFGLPGVILGGSYVAGGAEVTAQLDSETRFLSAMALGIGIGALWLFRSFETRPKAALLLSSAALLGGVMRLVSMAQFGAPGTTAILATGIELAVPLSVMVLLRSRAQRPG